MKYPKFWMFNMAIVTLVFTGFAASDALHDRWGLVVLEAGFALLTGLLAIGDYYDWKRQKINPK